jgi:hypothetical protein
MKGNFSNIKYYSKLTETKELIPLSALLLAIFLSLAACAGPAVEGALLLIMSSAAWWSVNPEGQRGCEWVAIFFLKSRIDGLRILNDNTRNHLSTGLGNEKHIP